MILRSGQVKLPVKILTSLKVLELDMSAVTQRIMVGLSLLL